MPFTSKTSARVTNRIPLVVTAFGTGSKRSAKTAASKIGKRVQEVIREPGRTGRMYGTHQASAPGEPPANWTGELADSVTIEPGPGHSAYMIVGAEYGPWLEYGTVHMAPRPFVEPTVKEFSAGGLGGNGIGQIFKDAIASAIKSVLGRFR